MLKRRPARSHPLRAYTRGRSADQEAANIVIIIHARSKLSRPESRKSCLVAAVSYGFRSFLMTSVVLMERL